MGREPLVAGEGQETAGQNVEVRLADPGNLQKKKREGH